MSKILSKDEIKTLGDILTVFNPALAFIIVMVWYRDIHHVVSLLTIYGIGNLLVQFIKGICDADRPREGGEYETIKIHGYSHKDGESCCSGHAVSAALPAFYFLIFINWIMAIPFLLFSIICAWTRVKVKAHWVFDVILANIIALFTNITIQWIVLRFINDYNVYNL